MDSQLPIYCWRSSHTAPSRSTGNSVDLYRLLSSIARPRLTLSIAVYPGKPSVINTSRTSWWISTNDVWCQTRSTTILHGNRLDSRPHYCQTWNRRRRCNIPRLAWCTLMTLLCQLGLYVSWEGHWLPVILPAIFPYFRIIIIIIIIISLTPSVVKIPRTKNIKL